MCTLLFLLFSFVCYKNFNLSRQARTACPANCGENYRCLALFSSLSPPLSLRHRKIVFHCPIFPAKSLSYHMTQLFPAVLIDKVAAHWVGTDFWLKILNIIVLNFHFFLFRWLCLRSKVTLRFGGFNVFKSLFLTFKTPTRSQEFSHPAYCIIRLR